MRRSLYRLAGGPSVFDDMTMIEDMIYEGWALYFGAFCSVLASKRCQFGVTFLVMILLLHTQVGGFFDTTLDAFVGDLLCSWTDAYGLAAHDRLAVFFYYDRLESQFMRND